ncbi:MAG: anaerobic ribonucleoside triphosphate reductase [Bacillota bacterium]|nr:anaerobic ribonucleoside triphosphate reductase [Bacillota bacterium]
MPRSITKRDGSLMHFDLFKIRQAIVKANRTIPSETLSSRQLDEITAEVIARLDPASCPHVEEIQDLVELTLMEHGVLRTAKAYIVYRAEHGRRREHAAQLMDIYKQLSTTAASDSDLKRENANIDGDTAMGTMLKYGSEGAKTFLDAYILPEDMAEAHSSGLIHIHDKDFYLLTATCCQIDLTRLFSGGFSTGHGFLRQPQSIASYAALACIAIQANQNEMHGGQSIPNFDFALAPGVNRSCQKHLADLLEEAALYRDRDSWPAELSGRLETMDYDELCKVLNTSPELPAGLRTVLDLAHSRTVRDTYQAMQALVHNLNTMNSRAGAQVPFSSVNYGTDTSAAGRLVIEQLLLATEDGLGEGETAIFPVQIFKVKRGVNSEPEDPNNDLFRLAIRVSAKRLFPNFSFLDAPFNAQYYRAGDPNSEVAYMGCRTRVIGNVYDPRQEVTMGRGNLSFTSINLPRLGIEARGDLDAFYRLLDEAMDLVFRQLRHRFEIQKRKTRRNFPFLMGQGIWLDSDTLSADEELGRVFRHGTLSVGFIGLAETLVALTGEHHGSSPDSQRLGLEIIGHMRERCDRRSQAEQLNYTLLATPAEGLSGRFVRIDRKRYGLLPGITDRDFYTNSFHIPVYYTISATRKISLEAPYHALTNAGHITYVELDGDPSQNLAAFERLILQMRDAGVGYGSINHPLDRDPVCGYNGVIGDRCPRCGRQETPEQPFQRIRRITGYLVGTLDRFNDAKRAEEAARVKHG